MEGPISGYVKLMDSVRPGIIFSAVKSLGFAGHTGSTGTYMAVFR